MWVRGAAIRPVPSYAVVGRDVLDAVEDELANSSSSPQGRGSPKSDLDDAFGRFERSLRVPAGCDPDTVHASLTDGVLTVNVPRPQPPQPKRIQIAAGESGQTQA